MDAELLTPYERGNGNQTTTLDQCIAFYKLLEGKFPNLLRMFEIGRSDAGTPIYAGIVASDGVFDLPTLKADFRPIFFNNNGIHPGEPEGIDACMAMVRNLCTSAQSRKLLGSMAYLFIPVYNVDGCLNRADTSRVNQQGPEQFGFRGNAINLDLNRDFIKCDSRNAQVFNQFFAQWDPDVMVDTHTSNGADYAYTMTVIATQPDKLGDEAGALIRDLLIPEVSANMAKRGWPFCPYVNPVKETPDDGIEDFLDTPRFSTGYAALHHTIGFMPETHMLKSFKDRYESMLVFLEEMLAFSSTFSQQIQASRLVARQRNYSKKEWTIRWKPDYDKPARFRFRGYSAKYRPSVLGNYSRLYYDRSEPYEKEIDYFNRYAAELTVPAAEHYVVPRQWQAVIDRLRWNGVHMEPLSEAAMRQVQSYHIKSVKSRSGPYEGHMFHDEIDLELRIETVQLHAGDFLVSLKQDNARYVVETLEPLAHDSLFRWGFFNSILEKKEAYSDYVFEDTAAELVSRDADLRRTFEAWKVANPVLVSDQQAVLDFIFAHCKEYAEPEWRRYPIFRLV